jgi:hypothetical protein
LQYLTLVTILVKCTQQEAKEVQSEAQGHASRRRL